MAEGMDDADMCKWVLDVTAFHDEQTQPGSARYSSALQVQRKAE